VDTSQANKKISAQDATQVEIAQPLHFSGPDGSDVVVQTRTYHVQQASNSEIRLVSTTAVSSIFLSAQTTSSTPDVSKPMDPPQPRPDLVPTCLWYPQQVVAPNFLPLYFVNNGVKNQGTVAAGASQARYASSTLSVPILQPGQVHTLVFSFTNVSPPSASVQVDSASQVAESNEQNNSGQQRCRSVPLILAGKPAR